MRKDGDIEVDKKNDDEDEEKGKNGFNDEAGADPGIFERGGPEAIIYKILERGGPKSLKMAFECSFQSLSYKSFANIPQKGGAQAPWAPPLNPPL